MSLLFRSYPFVRKILFTMEPEKAHQRTLKLLHTMHNSFLNALFPASPICPVQFLGHRLKNPIGLAAGLDKNGAHIDALAALGFGWIEVGTVTPLAQSGNPSPRLFRLTPSKALINRMGFNNEGLEMFLKNVKNSHFRQRGGILGLNIGKNANTPIEQAADDYCKGLTAVYPYADYVTVNISSPNTANLRDLQAQAALEALLQKIAETRRILSDQHQKQVPILIKIAPDMPADSLKELVDTVIQQQMDGIIATNTSLQREGVAHLEQAQEAGGLSGAPIHGLSLNTIRTIRAHAGASFPIVGVGGILSAEDARATLEAGANVLQLYTGLIYQGPRLIRECVEAYRSLHTQQ